MSAFAGRLKKIISDDSMSIALFGLFLICLPLQALCGWLANNQARTDAGLGEIGFLAYLGTGHFLDGIFSNWQAAILQLAVLIAFGSVLRQKGAPHSRQTDLPSHRVFSWKLHRRRNLGEWLYANSLSLAFLGMFAACFALHAVFGRWKYNEDQALRHLAPATFAAYVSSSDFWLSVFACWQAEFFAIGVYIVLSIFLRQSESSESKPVGASDAETGKANK